MTHALLIVGFAADSTSLGSNERAAWSNFLPDAIHRAEASKTVERIGAGTWLIPLDSDLQIFCELVQLAHVTRVPVRVLFSEARPVLASVEPA
jgi:hypothetical protein